MTEIRGLFFAKARGDGASAKQGRVSKRLKRSKERRRRPDSDNDGDGKIGRDKKANEFNHLPHAESLFGDGALVAGHERNVAACRRSGSDDKGGPGRRRGAARSRGDADGICSRGDFQGAPHDLGHHHAAALLLLLLLLRSRTQRRDAHATRGGQCLHLGRERGRQLGKREVSCDFDIFLNSGSPTSTNFNLSHFHSDPLAASQLRVHLCVPFRS